MNFIIFFAIFLCIYLGAHYYVYYQLCAGLLLKHPFTLILRIFILFGALSFIIAEIISRKSVSLWIKPFAYYGNIWIGIISITFVVLLARNILILFFKNPAARYYSAIFSIVMALGLSSFSFLNILSDEKIKEITVKTNKLPPNIKNISIVQLSDLHLNFLKFPHRLKRIIEETNSLNPDIIVLTGDLIDADIAKEEKYISILKKLKSKDGIYAITGNHEFYAGLDKFNNLVKLSGITPLRNEFVQITDKILIAGIDDPGRESLLLREKELVKLLNSALMRDEDNFTILLSHRPDFFDTSSEMGIDLQLSGHSHAGQIPPMDILVMLFTKYPYGLYLKNNSVLYTSCGTGYWGPPMRLFSRSEIVYITIENMNSADQ